MKHDFEGWIQSQGWSPVADDRVSACSAVVLQPFVFELTPSVESLNIFQLINQLVQSALWFEPGISSVT